MASLTSGGLPSNENRALPSVQQAAKRAGERAEDGTKWRQSKNNNLIQSKQNDMWRYFRFLRH